MATDKICPRSIKTLSQTCIFASFSLVYFIFAQTASQTFLSPEKKKKKANKNVAGGLGVLVLGLVGEKQKRDSPPRRKQPIPRHFATKTNNGLFRLLREKQRREGLILLREGFPAARQGQGGPRSPLLAPPGRSPPPLRSAAAEGKARVVTAQDGSDLRGQQEVSEKSDLYLLWKTSCGQTSCKRPEILAAGSSFPVRWEPFHGTGAGSGHGAAGAAGQRRSAFPGLPPRCPQSSALRNSSLLIVSGRHLTGKKEKKQRGAVKVSPPPRGARLGAGVRPSPEQAARATCKAAGGSRVRFKHGLSPLQPAEKLRFASPLRPSVACI
ncbi:uncharacterized protein LOC134147020 [Rhea pennata]|uniref:uncharacterized protein LOC134147020 n=1 Tax=Rhea pennata TaxID=8795 RepID=UPI002E269ED6